MTPDDPRHGTYAGYQQHARDGERACASCYGAKGRYFKRLEYDHARGLRRRIPVGEVAHANAVALANITESEWFRSTGMTANIRRRVIADGPDSPVLSRTRARLERIDPHEIRAGLLTHIGCIRRVQALARIGHSAPAIARAAGIAANSSIRMLQEGSARFSSHTTRRKIAAAYDTLHLTPVPRDRITSRTLNLAERNGWAPPLAWDNIDDPNEQPKGVGDQVVRRADLLAELDGMHVGITEACARLGIKRRHTLAKWCERNGCYDVYQRMAAREDIMRTPSNQYTGGAA